jgi:WD40 repeat protein
MRIPLTSNGGAGQGIGQLMKIDGKDEGMAVASTAPREWPFDVFISYRRSDGTACATWLRAVLERYRLPKALGRTHRRLKCYLDTKFTRPVDFWESNIKPSLSDSRFLVVVMTQSIFHPLPDGAPNWVMREIEHFMRLPQGGNVIVLSLDGPPERQLPQSLAERFPRLHIIDLRRFRSGPSGVLTRLRLKDDLIPVIGRLNDVPIEDTPRLRQEHERRQRTTAWSIAGTSLLLVLALLGLTAYANNEKVNAEKQRRIALARQLAAQSRSLLTGSVYQQPKVLLAIEAMEIFPDFEIDQALRELLSRAGANSLDLHGYAKAAKFSPDGRYVALWNGDNLVRVFETNTGKELAQITCQSPVLALAFSNDGRHIATGSKNGTAQIFETATGREISHFSEPVSTFHDPEPISAIAVSPDLRYLAVAGTHPRVFDVASGKEITNLSKLGFSHEENFLAFSPDGRYLAAGTMPGLIFDPLTGNEIARFRNHIGHLAFSADGRYLATSPALTGNVEILETTSGKVVVKLRSRYQEPGHINANALAFSPDRRYLVTTSGLEMTRVFDTTAGGEIIRMAETGEVLAISFNRDGHDFMTVSSGVLKDRLTLRRNPLQPQDLIKLACSWVGESSLTLDDWRKYVGPEVPYHKTCPYPP